MAKMTRAHLFAFVLLTSGALLGATSSCKASLDTSCVDGACGPVPAGKCVYSDTHGLPCDVYSVLAENCQGCHQDPPKSGAPFALLTYDDTQKPFPGTPEPIWQEMRKQIQPGASPGMPFGKNPPGLAQADRDVLEAWFKTCDAGACATGQGSGSSSSGAGGGSSSSAASSGSSSATSSTGTSSGATSSSGTSSSSATSTGAGS